MSSKKPKMNSEIMRSFGRVQGRKLRAEAMHMVENILPKVAISDDVGDLKEAFGHSVKEICLEIGFGGGEHLAEYAKANPNTGCIGCEPFINGVSRLLKYIDKDGIANVRIFHGDARLLLEKTPDNSFDKIFLLFPDPWPKARHHKKRIVTNEMLIQLARVLKKGGVLEIATDHVAYAEWIAEHLERCEKLVETDVTKGKRSVPPIDWIRTRYQEKGEEEGRGATFFNFMKKH